MPFWFLINYWPCALLKPVKATMPDPATQYDTALMRDQSFMSDISKKPAVTAAGDATEEPSELERDIEKAEQIR